LVGVIGGCNALEPILFVSDLIKSLEVIQESSDIDTEGDANPQESMSESATVQVT